MTLILDDESIRTAIAGISTELQGLQQRQQQLTATYERVTTAAGQDEASRSFLRGFDTAYATTQHNLTEAITRLTDIIGGLHTTESAIRAADDTFLNLPT